MAALNAKSCGTSGGSVTVMVEVEKACYPICTLNPEKIPQQSLDYVFTEGEEVLFYTEGGDMEVHLTGAVTAYQCHGNHIYLPLITITYQSMTKVQKTCMDP